MTACKGNKDTHVGVNRYKFAILSVYIINVIDTHTQTDSHTRLVHTLLATAEE